MSEGSEQFYGLDVIGTGEDDKISTGIRQAYTTSTSLVEPSEHVAKAVMEGLRKTDRNDTPVEEMEALIEGENYRQAVRIAGNYAKEVAGDELEGAAGLIDREKSDFGSLGKEVEGATTL